MKGKRAYKFFVCFFLVVGLLILAPFSGHCVEKPKSVVLALAGTGTAGYQSGTALAASLQEITGVRFATIPATKPLGRTGLMRDGRAQFMWSPAVDSLFALEGRADFNELGPQSIRGMWDSGPIDQGMATRANSGIKTLQDMRGKRVATYPTSPTNQLYVDAVLAYANLKWEDVIPSPVSSFPAGQRALIEGAVDAVPFSGQSAPAYELEASLHGIHWLSMPNKTPEDKAAWARYNKVNPAFYANTVTTAAASSKDNPVYIWGYNYQGTCYDWSDQDMVYWMVKLLAENYDTWSQNHAYLKKWTVEHNLNSELWYVPRAEGYIRYFKEVGKWTSQMEAKQKYLLAKYPQVMTK